MIGKERKTAYMGNRFLTSEAPEDRTLNSLCRIIMSDCCRCVREFLIDVSDGTFRLKGVHQLRM